MAKQAGVFKNQTFRLNAPTAKKVLLVGDFTNWQQRGIPMQKGNDGVWMATVGLPMGSHHYLFIVGRDDDVINGQNMVLHVA